MAKILIAEDESDIRELITLTLEMDGYQVFPCDNGDDAIRIAKEEKPNLILLDVRMPRKTGYEACTAIKAEAELKDIPIVFLSAKGQESEVKAGMSVGAVDYILKPFAPDRLLREIRQLLSQTGVDAPDTPIIDPARAVEEAEKQKPKTKFNLRRFLQKPKDKVRKS